MRLLKDRLGQMEMFFLQHATGVASTKLTPTALRTLSGAGSNAQDLMKLREETDESEDQISDPENLEPRSQIGEQDREIVEYDPKIFTANQDVSSNLDDTHVYNPAEVVEILKLTKLESPGATPKAESKKDPVDDDEEHQYIPLSKKRSFIAPGKGNADPVHPRVAAMSKQLQDAVRLSNEVSLLLFCLPYNCTAA